MEVSLARIAPRIWRRFLLRADLSFADLHRAIQESFGWENKHHWEFLRLDARGASVAGPRNQGGDGRPSPDASPEDCGGPPGYQRATTFLETGEDIFGDEPEELREWLGDWRPEAFDVAKVKAGFDR